MSLLNRIRFLKKPLRYESKALFALWGIQITIFISVAELADMIGSIIMPYRERVLFEYDFILLILCSEVLLFLYMSYLAVKVIDLEELYTKFKFIGAYLCCTLIARLLILEFQIDYTNNYNNLYIMTKGLWVLFCFIYGKYIRNIKITSPIYDQQHNY